MPIERPPSPSLRRGTLIRRREQVPSPRSGPHRHRHRRLAGGSRPSAAHARGVTAPWRFDQSSTSRTTAFVFVEGGSASWNPNKNPNPCVVVDTEVSVVVSPNRNPSLLPPAAGVRRGFRSGQRGKMCGRMDHR